MIAPRGIPGLTARILAAIPAMRASRPDHYLERFSDLLKIVSVSSDDT